MKVGQVIYIEFPSNNFSWANGLKVIVGIKKEVIEIVSINNKGELSLFDDGKYMKAITGINNKGIKVIEWLTYEVNESLL